MTEDEAKTKTCHKTLAAVGMSPDGIVHAPAACIGSACMAWRWENWKYGHTKYGKDWKSEGGPLTGYCGLAGKP
jgi:hypothetical protein